MAKVKTVKKQWYPIYAPKIFKNVFLGETLAYKTEQMIGKRLKQNLMALTNNTKRQNINIEFEVARVQNGRALADIIGYFMVPSTVKRLVRRGVEKINMSFICKTKDNKNIRIKPLLHTLSLTTSSVVANIRRSAQEFLVTYIQKVTYEAIIDDLVNNKLHNALRAHLKKIYPLRVCEIRVMELLGDIKADKKLKAKNATEINKAE